MSKTYMVAYDLGGLERDYEHLIDEIKTYDRYVHILDSSWIIKSDDSAFEIRDNLKSHVDFDDELLVTECGSEWATTFTNERTSWMHDNFNK